jgi:hypothetical protein
VHSYTSSDLPPFWRSLPQEPLFENVRSLLPDHVVKFCRDVSRKMSLHRKGDSLKREGICLGLREESSDGPTKDVSLMMVRMARSLIMRRPFNSQEDFKRAGWAQRFEIGLRLPGYRRILCLRQIGHTDRALASIRFSGMREQSILIVHWWT